MSKLQSNIPPLLVSVRQGRELLGGISNNLFWRLVRDGELQLIGSARKRWCTVASIEGYVARQVAAARVEKGTSEPLNAEARHA